MNTRSLLRSASNGLSVALLLTVATSAITCAAPPDQAQAQAEPDGPQILQIESQGSRAFAGTRVYNPEVPDGSRFLACDHGIVDWQIPPGARNTPLVLTHGSGIRVYQTTMDGRPGFQSLFLGEGYAVYLVDYPGIGRADQGCEAYTYTPNLNANRVFENRIGTWPVGQPQPTYFPDVAFAQDPETLNQNFRVQYQDSFMDTQAHRALEGAALAVLLDEIYAEGEEKAVVFNHSSGSVSAFRAGLSTDNVAGYVSFEPGNGAALFPEGEVPMITLTDGTQISAGSSLPLEEFRTLAAYPQLFIWGDNIPAEVDAASTTEPVLSVRAERFKLMAAALNKYGGDAVNLYLPEQGIFGNTHRVMADTNNTEVAEQIKLWMAEHGLDR